MRVEVKGKKLDGKPQSLLDQTIWVDDKGKIGKSFTDAFGGFTSVRTTKKFATSENKGKELDSINKPTSRLRGRLPIPINARRWSTDFACATASRRLFPSDARQQVSKGEDEHSALVAIHTFGPNDGTAGPEKVATEYLRANPMIDSADPTVVARAREATATAASPWDKAKAIENYVFKKIEDKNFKTAFAPATEVARTLTGDCTEHAVLVAAMCRASGNPGADRHRPDLRGAEERVWVSHVERGLHQSTLGVDRRRVRPRLRRPDARQVVRQQFGGRVAVRRFLNRRTNQQPSCHRHFGDSLSVDLFRALAACRGGVSAVN